MLQEQWGVKICQTGRQLTRGRISDYFFSLFDVKKIKHLNTADPERRLSESDFGSNLYVYNVLPIRSSINTQFESPAINSIQFILFRPFTRHHRHPCQQQITHYRNEVDGKEIHWY